MQNMLFSKQIYDYFENVVIVAPSQNFQTIRPFSKSPTLFFGQPHSNQGTKMFCQMIAQWELLHKNHNFATHVPNVFKKLFKY